MMGFSEKAARIALSKTVDLNINKKIKNLRITTQKELQSIFFPMKMWKMKKNKNLNKWKSKFKKRII